MIKTMLVPDNQDVLIKLPESFVGKKVEIIAFTSNEVDNESQVIDKPMTHYASQQVLSKDWLTSDEDRAWENL